MFKAISGDACPFHGPKKSLGLGRLAEVTQQSLRDVGLD